MYRVVEYIIFPMIAVIITFIVKSFLAPRRIDKKEVITELGYDVMIMCFFGLMLDSIGSYSHHQDAGSIVTYSITGFIGAILSLSGLFMVLFMDILVFGKENDADVKLDKRYKCLLRWGISYVVVLVSFVMYGTYIEDTIVILQNVKK